MTVFAVDSSSLSASAAVIRDGAVIAESFANVGLTHSETLLPICDEVFKRACLTPAEIDYFAVTSGPGSFTGLRIGMGVVKGLAFASKKPCVSVPTFEALAFGMLGTARTVVATSDARRERVYCAQFSCEKGIERLSEDGILTLDELGESLLGKSVVFVGDAADICYNYLRERLDCVKVCGSQKLLRAGSVGIAALSHIEAGDVLTADELVPSYVQLPSAEINLRRKLEN
ncbi:MAG: tRNA (adenosine(37)-N6)-threonylcarbamoyltransferase complex dimerization subunit type 1 TsaB [Ruminococcaceae bacterium]|nr:tRNA (adenosine(37)-N6)-threonylcarbamoyltransferase complex dimerization subunit type 1 TsaB [Oscillospiraceae bacterium]